MNKVIFKLYFPPLLLLAAGLLLSWALSDFIPARLSQPSMFSALLDTSLSAAPNIFAFQSYSYHQTLSNVKTFKLFFLMNKTS